MKRIVLSFILSLIFVVTAYSQTTGNGLKITHLTNDFYIFTSSIIYKGQPTPANGMYLVTKKGVVMIDTPWDSTQYQPLLDSIELKHHKKVVLAIATHSHDDRAGGLEFLKSKGIKTFTSLQTDQICKANHLKHAEFTFAKDTTFTVGQYKFSTFYAGEGHTKDNLIIWFAKNKILYGGCLVKSSEATELGAIGEANLKEWPKTINKLKRKYPDAKYVITGHNAWGGLNVLDHTLKLIAEKKD